VVPEAPAVERRVVCIEHASALRRDRPRHADADGAARAGLALGLDDQASELSERGVIPGMRCRRALAQALLARFVEHGELDLRAAQVNAHAQARISFPRHNSKMGHSKKKTGSDAHKGQPKSLGRYEVRGVLGKG